MTSYYIAEEGMTSDTVRKIQNQILHGAISYTLTLCHAVIYHPQVLSSPCPQL